MPATISKSNELKIRIPFIWQKIKCTIKRKKKCKMFTKKIIKLYLKIILTGKENKLLQKIAILTNLLSIKFKNHMGRVKG